MNTKQYSKEILQAIKEIQYKIIAKNNELKSTLSSQEKRRKRIERKDLKAQLETLKSNKLPEVKNKLVVKGFA
ncbi:MAG: hypothetical protein KBD14_02250 [Candidatus Pacebacteria bacterium]|nr:hypothetical protein [Candidatus Paceibacterota bacterium]